MPNTKDILEKETEARLQTIPSAYDRRKMRGLIQRIRTHDRKICEKLVECAKQEEWKRCVDSLDFDHSKCVLKQSCIGYGSAQSDLMNNPPK